MRPNRLLCICLFAAEYERSVCMEMCVLTLRYPSCFHIEIVDSNISLSTSSIFALRSRCGLSARTFALPGLGQVFVPYSFY